MSLYLDPDSDEAHQGPLFNLPDHLRNGSQNMHASAVVIGRYGILLRGPTGSGKSLLQRHLRKEAKARGLYAALVSDDYVQLARHRQSKMDPPPLLAFAPVATSGMQEVRGLGVIELEKDHVVSCAVMHLLVDLINPDLVERMPAPDQIRKDCLGAAIAHLSAPERRAVAASDLVFARLSTWKAGA